MHICEELKQTCEYTVTEESDTQAVIPEEECHIHNACSTSVKSEKVGQWKIFSDRSPTFNMKRISCQGRGLCINQAVDRNFGLLSELAWELKQMNWQSQKTRCLF